MSGKAEGNGKGNGDTPIDFNDCVSKNELRAVLDDKFNEILQQITNLAKRIEDVEQWHPEPRPEEDDDDLSKEDDGDVEAEAEAQWRAEDARNRNRLNFNWHGMWGNNQGNNDLFSKTKFWFCWSWSIFRLGDGCR